MKSSNLRDASLRMRKEKNYHGTISPLQMEDASDARNGFRRHTPVTSMF